MTRIEYISRRLEKDFINYVLLRRPLYSAAEVSLRLLRTVDSNGRYNAMKEAIDRVCARHLDLDRLRGEDGSFVSELPAWLKPELAYTILADYRREIEAQLSARPLLPALLGLIERLVWAQGVDDMAANLRRFLDDLRRYAAEYAGMPHADLDAYDLESKYAAAARITLRERTVADNCDDIADFRSALLGYAADLCREELYRAMARLFGDVLGSERIQAVIEAFETAHRTAAEELKTLEAMQPDEEYEREYARLVPVAFYERNVEDISGARAFQMIVLLALARNEPTLREQGLLTPSGELTLFTSPSFDGLSWRGYDFYKLI